MPYTIKRTLIEWLFWIVFILVFILAIPLMYFIAPKKGDVIRIDCTWSEISPDFSPEMKEACRKARIGNHT
jgi:short subunit fatty acids transporter